MRNRRKPLHYSHLILLCWIWVAPGPLAADPCEECRAGRIACGDSGNGRIEEGDCETETGALVDVWTLDLPTASEVRIAVTSPDLGTVAVLVTDSRCGEIAASATATSSPLDLTLPAGEYRVIVATSDASETGRYSLETSCEEVGNPCADCPAPQLSCGAVVSGTLTAEDCEFPDGSRFDAYGFDLVAPETVSVEVRSDSLDPLLAILDATCDEVAVASGSVAALDVELAPGRYSLIVGDSGASLGGYEVLFRCAARDAPFRRGDANEDGSLDLGDPVRILIELFAGPDDPSECPDALDANDDGTVDLADAVHLLRFLFRGADAPPSPLGACGPDPSGEDDLDCRVFAGCA